ncbi:MAG TPA: PDZ domain-containing protein [Lautropia sp.]|nr:PDZ domain-containing protein [Lautropia sp.]
MLPIHYTIRPSDPNAHLFEVSLCIADPSREGQRLRLPVWIPGSYMIREFSRHLEGVEATVRDLKVGLSKISKNTWLCGPLPAAARGPLQVSYRVYAWDLSVRAAHLDASHGFFNGTSVFLAVEGREAEPCSVDILPPHGAAFSGWRIATTLPAAKGAGAAKPFGFGRYEAGNYDELIDHPVEIGLFQLGVFDVGGCRHEVAVTGRTDVDLTRLTRDLKPICREHIALFEPVRRRAPVDRFLFLTMAVGDGYGGLEHRASTALLCARKDLPYADMKGVPEGYQSFLGLASHEYFHTWNVKRIKPARFDPYDLHQETYSSLLWIFEGFTSYYDDLALCRAGTITVQSYLSSVQRAVRSVHAAPGRLLQSVAESSFDAWIKYYRQDENSPNAVVSYYVKGSLVALCLDLTIRARTRSRRSLDDVMRLMWRRYGSSPARTAMATSTLGSASPGGHGLQEGEFPALLKEATGLDLRRQIERWAYQASELPLAQCLKPFGVTMRREADGDALSWLGARTVVRQSEVVIHSAHRDGPATRAGLSGGDRLVAIDGLRCDESTVKAMLARRRPGSQVRVHAFRRDELIEATVTLAAPQPVITLAAAGKNALRNAWLGAREGA